MELSVELFYNVGVYISIISFIIAPFGIFCSCYCLKTVHFNLKFLVVSLGIFWCSYAVFGALFILILHSDINPPELYQTLEYKIPKMLSSTFAYTFRTIETSICFERFLATFYFRIYEKRKIFRIYSFLAVLFSLFMGFCIAYLFNIFHVPAIVVYLFLITVETLNYFLLRALQKQNRLLRQLSNSSRALLTSKYQLIENIRSLKLLFPQIAISFVISNFTIVSTYIIGIFYEPYRVPTFLTLYCINIIMASIYWIYQSSLLTTKLRKCCKISSTKPMKSIEIDENDAIKTTMVKTALGQRIKANQTVDEHFNHLKDDWK